LANNHAASSSSSFNDELADNDSWMPQNLEAGASWYFS
jgi:hypothetical protein